MTRTNGRLLGLTMMAALAVGGSAARAQDETPVPALSPTPPATAQAIAAPQASIQAPIVAGGTVEYGTPMGCGSCGSVHGLGHGCFSVHAAYRQWIPGRRPVRLWGTCKFPLNTLTGPAGYWDSPGPMAGESIVPGAAFDRTPIPIGQMVP